MTLPAAAARTTDDGRGLAQRWRKGGLVLQSRGQWGWNCRYAGLPTAHVLVPEERVRVYYYALDEAGDGRIGFVEVASDDPGRVVYAHPEPVLVPGEAGHFDDCGVCPSCILPVGGQWLLYYLGVQRAEKGHLYFTGLAISDDDGRTFRKHAPVPLLDRSAEEPILRSAPSILVDPRGAGYRMWYVSARGWTNVGVRKYPTYVIRAAVSAEALTWRVLPGACFDFANEHEFGFGRPWVLHEGGRFRMWYSIRSRQAPYRMGYAESADGLAWTRLDERLEGLERSARGWDSEMVCYPCVVDAGGRRLMFHNGNGHGASGFGWAELEA